MGLSFRSHNLGSKGPDMVWWWPGSALRPFRAAARDLHMAVQNHFLRPNDAIGTQEGPGDTTAHVEASFFLLIFSNTRTLDHNTRTIGYFATSSWLDSDTSVVIQCRGVLRIPPGGSDPKFRRKRAHLDKKKRWGPPPFYTPGFQVLLPGKFIGWMQATGCECPRAVMVWGHAGNGV